MASPAIRGPILVPGGAGYVGCHTVRHLESLGVPVVVLDNLSTGHRQAVRSPIEEVDLSDREGVARVFARHRPAAVVHFAAKCYVGESVQNPSKYYRENVICTWNLLEAMRDANCLDIVFSSSCATYGQPVEMPMTDEHPQLPISPYGKTKLHMEHMMQDYGRAYGFRWAALRYFNAAGAARDGSTGEIHDPETHLIPLVLSVAAGRREKIQVFGDDYDTPDGTCIRDYVHVEDLARAHATALLRLQSGTKEIALNLGTGSGFSVLEVIETARKVTGKPIAREVVARRPGDPARLISGGSRAASVLGWKAERPAIADIVGDAWRFLASHPRGYES
jgi:UDP-glucose-4-epimerase GalE